MADYNIYIKNETKKGVGAVTKPTQTKAKKKSLGQVNETKAWETKIVHGINIATNPDSLVSQATSLVVSAIPYLAVAYAAKNLVVKTADTIISFNTVETGDYRASLGWNNFRQSFNAVFHPFSTTMDFAKTHQQWRIENTRKAMQRELLGDIVINSYNNRGV